MAEILRITLVIVVVAIAILGMLSLRRRRLSLVETLLWGLLALVIPLVGPFLVILLHPGKIERTPAKTPDDL